MQLNSAGDQTLLASFLNHGECPGTLLNVLVRTGTLRDSAGQRLQRGPAARRHFAGADSAEGLSFASALFRKVAAIISRTTRKKPSRPPSPLIRGNQNRVGVSTVVNNTIQVV